MWTRQGPRPRRIEHIAGGKVTSMDVSRNQATATLKLDTSPKIPADVVAEVRSVSAVGEQYVELLPRTDSPPYLQDGWVITARGT